MSEARWCDYGNHAYKAGRPGTIMLGTLEQAQGPGNSRNQVTQEVSEMCPECAAEVGLIKDYEAPIPPQERRAAILGRIEKEGAGK